MLFVNNFFIIRCTSARVAIFISGTSSELLVTGTSFLNCKKSLFHLMLNLHNGTCWYLYLRCFEIEHFCFGLNYLILRCNSITLHLLVYFGMVEGFLKGSIFLWAFNFNYVWKDFLPNRWPSSSGNEAVFPSANIF